MMRKFLIILLMTCQLLATAQTTLTTTSISGGDGDNCVVTDTRLNLINLRNTNSLIVGCHYVLTDHVQGRLVAGTTITLHADSQNEFSENVSVNTTYDNEGWRGIYDIDRALVLELTDNRNNVCRGINGTEVTNFDWGNTSYTNIVVDNATFTTTIGSIRTFTNVEIKNGASLNNTGQTNGTVSRLYMDGGTCTLSGANVSILGVQIRNGTLDATNYTGGTTLINWEIQDGGIVNISGSSSSVSLANLKIYNSTLSHVGVTTGTITGVGLDMSNASTITHNNGALNLSINRVVMENTGQLIQSSGSISLQDFHIENRALLQLSGGTATQNFSSISGKLSNSARVDLLGDMNVNATRFSALSNSQLLVQPGALGTITLTGSTFDDNSIFTVSATSTAGNITFNLSKMIEQATITKSGTGTLTATNAFIFNQGRVLHQNTRNVSISRVSVSNLATITSNSASIGTDGVTDVTLLDRSSITYNATGASSNNIFYTTLNGIGGAITFNGTTTGGTVQQSSVNNGSITCSNNLIANTILNANIETGSNLTVQNMTLTKAIQNIVATNGSTININNPTGAGSHTILYADNESSIIITGTATTSQRFNAVNGAGITHNGGQSVNIYKSLTGVLTTGNFNHQSLIMISPTSRTLTGANINRSEYLGVVSAVPLF